ncbi:MAG: type II toxin-antitoxin system RelE/ParE family toxin [Pseudomonadota bacterium]|nr:type II toxin-antitoxin system RelE/ParE family toxin [Pseudomonadota bacterium]
MRLEWTRLALQDFNEAQDYIAQDNPLAAQAVAQRIADAARRLLEDPEIGRTGQVAGTRECLVTRTSHLLVYRVNGDVIEILRVWHSRQDWQSPPAG